MTSGAPALGRRLLVDGTRLQRWVDGFAERHGAADAVATDQGFDLTGADGTPARVELPFLPWPRTEDPVPDAVAHLLRPRPVAVLLVRRGGYAVAAVADGRVTEAKVGRRHVQGRTAAGGWSQQRFARRRANQADDLLRAVAEVAVRILLPAGARWLVTGGDRALVARVLTDPRLAPLRDLPVGCELAVSGDPDRSTVADLPRLLGCATIRLP